MAILHHSHEAPRNCAGAAGHSPAGRGNGRNLSPFARALWYAAQYLLLLGGLALVWLLMARPAVGIAIMWNILIPAAPALVTILPGLWRNICPMATFSPHSHAPSEHSRPGIRYRPRVTFWLDEGRRRTKYF